MTPSTPARPGRLGGRRGPALLVAAGVAATAVAATAWLVASDGQDSAVEATAPATGASTFPAPSPSDPSTAAPSPDGSAEGVAASQPAADQGGAATSVLQPPPEVVAAGLSDPAALTPSDSIKIDEDGAVVENLDVTGTITVKANDVTIRNVRVRSSSDAFGIDVKKGYHGTVIEDVEVEVGLDGTSANAAIGGIGDHEGTAGTAPGDNVVVRSSYLHGSGDGIKAVNYGLYEGNRIEMTRGEGSVKHIDGIQSSGSSGWTARYNWISEPYSSGHNSAIFAQPFTGKRDKPISGITIENNWVNGGVYTIQLGDAKDGQEGLVTDVVIADNVFYDDFKYGAYLTRGAEDVTGNGGVWAVSGEPVPTGEVSRG